ncbi:hypothetical protein ACIHCM_34800 [Streptomyces sp. NPDC052023]|uniref:hypothetical protein n=1 Tax=Streptomyces sp. NPDC052023 TaxID=3365681 RepID=UPI0037D45866
MSTHPDLPDHLVHFTGRPRGQDEEVPDFAQGSPEERLVNILHNGVLRGNTTFWTDAPVICFSEVTEEARRAMLRHGVHRGPYPPWGLVLDRQQLIATGARPALYVSRTEQAHMKAELPRRTYNRCVVYEPDAARGRSDWLFEREWRLCYGPAQTAELTITPALVAGVIVGRRGWMPPPRQVVAADVVDDLKTQLRALPALVQSWREQLPDGASIQSIHVSASSTRTRFAGAADRLARWYWDGDDLIPDGHIDIHHQQMSHSPFDDQGPAIEVGYTLDLNE